MSRENFATVVSRSRLSERETSIRVIWFAQRFEGRADLPFTDILNFFHENGISHPNRSRLEARLSADRRILRQPNGNLRLRASALDDLDPEMQAAVQITRPTTALAEALEASARKITQDQTRNFVQEAISCVRHALPRAAIIMAWCGAVSVLQEFVHKYELDAFNADAVRSGLLKSPAKTLADMRDISKESQFLECLGRISVIDDATKRALKRCLDRRNDVGHPSEVRLSDAGVADHIETLILNVFDRFVPA